MRVLITIVVVLAVLAGTLWIVGGRVAIYQATVVIRNTPDRVFDHLVRPELLTRWMGGLVESVPLGDPTLRPGARSREVVEENGRRMVFESEIIRVEPGRLLEVSITGDMFLFESRFRLEAEGSGTRIHYTIEARYSGVARLVAPFVRSAVQRKIDGDLDRLRQLAGEPGG